MKISITANTSWYLFNFRKNTILALIKAGHEVIAISPDTDYKSKIENLGCKFAQIRMQRKGKNPLFDLMTVFDFYTVFKKENVELTLNFTPKNNIYASLAARIMRIKVINNIAGLGVVFIEKTFISRLVSTLYKFSQKKVDFIFFQNNEDKDIFIKKGIVSSKKCARLPGSGVDLSRFEYSVVTEKDKIRFLLVARLIAEKGIYIYAEAASILRKKYPNLEFCLLGQLDKNSLSAVKPVEINEWHDKKIINYLGFTDSVEKEMMLADCIVLPSYYREGVPKSLLEGAAIGRPIITTRNVGCKEVVEDGINGFLCEPKSRMSLIESLEKFINLPHKDKIAMGVNSRIKIKNEFDEMIVIDKYLEVINRLK